MISNSKIVFVKKQLQRFTIWFTIMFEMVYNLVYNIVEAKV